MSVQDTLIQAGYPQYAEAFVTKGLTPAQLTALTDADLQAMGVESSEHRQALLALFKGAAPSTAPAASSPSRSMVPWVLGCLILLAVGLVGLLVLFWAVGLWTLGIDKDIAKLASATSRAYSAAERESPRVPPPLPAEPVPMAPTYGGEDKAALAHEDEGADSEDEMRRPIDALYEAWRTLDAAQYAAQWAPGATRTDLKSGKVSTAEQVIRSRSALFPKLQRVDAQHTSRLLSFEDGVATFYTRYTMTITSGSGKTSSEVANESYRVKKINRRWLIIENRDYEP